MNKPFFGPEPAGGASGDIRPLVAIRKREFSVGWFAGAAVVAAALLFSALEARRRGNEPGAGQMPAPSALAASEAIPELIVPVLPVTAPALNSAATWALPGGQQFRVAASPAPQFQGTSGQSVAPRQSYPTASPYQAPAPAPPLLVSGAADGGFAMPVSTDARPAAGAGQAGSPQRIIPGRLESPATTVVQGTLINAVLETALDSTSPGQSRALVTRDVFGFDGTRVLIPRGSRLYGDYEADVAQGQNRAQIRWSRLLRPDGVSVALDSPAADPLGRAGVKGRVNSHFLQRFGNALLGTTLNLGSAIGMRSIAPPVVVALPGAAQTAGQSMVGGSREIAPTLTVRQGTRVTVFVQHDLDFASIDEVAR